MGRQTERTAKQEVQEIRDLSVDGTKVKGGKPFNPQPEPPG
jgi:hypothetical protein